MSGVSGLRSYNSDFALDSTLENAVKGLHSSKSEKT